MCRQSPEWLTELDIGETLHEVDCEDLPPQLMELLLSQHSLLRQDQAIRPLLHVYNDLLWQASEELSLETLFSRRRRREQSNIADIERALDELADSRADRYIRNISRVLAGYDWRASTWPGYSEVEQRNKQALRGTGGYKVLRLDLLKLLAKSQNKRLSSDSAELIKALGS